MIEVQNLVKKYGSKTVVDDLSFQVEKGHIYGFLGPNGAGKSTTMNILTGYMGATSGTVLIDGVDLQKEPKRAMAKVGYMPEVLPLYQDMKVREYLDFVAELKQIDKTERENQVQKVLQMTNLKQDQTRLIRNLSKGYKQRIGIAQAILGSPELIIFDEPTVGLDPKQVIEFRNLVKKLKEKHTILISSHILSEIREICDKIIIISEGRLVAVDTPEHLASMKEDESTLLMKVSGDRSKICEVLDANEGVKSYSFTAEGEPYEISIVVTNEKKAREELFYQFADAKLPIEELQVKESSLEDVFLRLIESAETSEETTKEDSHAGDL